MSSRQECDVKSVIAGIMLVGAMTTLVVLVADLPDCAGGQLVSAGIVLCSTLLVLGGELGLNWVLADARLGHEENDRLSRRVRKGRRASGAPHSGGLGR